MKLWLDDIREPWRYGKYGWTWAKTAEEAINWLSTGAVTEASLDHDLSFKQMEEGGVFGKIFDDGEATGYTVCLWLEVHPEFFPKNGVKVHSMNPAGRKRMEQVLEKIKKHVEAEHTGATGRGADGSDVGAVE